MTQQPLPMKAVAAVLGVTSNQIYMWGKRRHTTGFPEPVASLLVTSKAGDKRGQPLFDLDAVVDWWAGYEPNSNRGSHWAEKRKAKS